jgi:hypothetical protein
MFPLIAIAGVISAVATTIKGASWLSDKVGSAQAAPSAGAKPGAKAQTDARSSAFEAALTAQAAGQTVPGSGSGTPAGMIQTSSAAVPLLHGTDYGSLARMQAGMAAYSHIGEHHGNHPGAAKQPEASDESR